MKLLNWFNYRFLKTTKTENENIDDSSRIEPQKSKQTRFLRQQTLYFWFIFIMLLPCMALALTEPMSVWVRIASVMLPMAVYVLLFNLFRKPGYFLIICFILLLINGYQLVLIYLFNESVVSPDMFLNIVTTDAGESGELMRTIWPAVLLACILYFSATALGIYSIINKRKLPVSFTKQSCIYALIPAIIGLGSLLINHAKGFPFRLDHDIYPVNALYNLNFATHKLIRTVNYPETSKDFTFNAVKEETSSQREVYVLVVGETSRAANWQLYGYGRQTNPLLSQRDDVVVFKDVLSQGNTTHKIVPMILSSACAEDFNRVYVQKSLITAFKEAGFQTAYISNQIRDRAFIDAFASEADTTIRISEEEGDDRHRYDNEALPYISKMVNESDHPLLIVFHTYGSHFEYSQRYAPENALFTPDKAGALRYKERPVFLNAYDNTICNVDRLLNGIIQILEDANVCSSMMYLSDHGEDLMDDERKMFLHCSPVPTYYQLHIPLLMWFSEEYKNAFPINYNAAVNNRLQPASTNAVFHTMLDLSRINTFYKDETYSLVNESFEVRKRYFIDEHDEPEDFFTIGLKKQDWEMIEKMKIKI
ncbi:MAG: phosphoethanolamine transferase [Bacteroidales bacterium]